MSQQYTSLGASTLSAPILSGDGSLTVVSAATFPLAATFQIQLDDGVNVELCTVTGVAGAVFSIARGLSPTTPHDFAAGTAVTEVWCKESVDQVRADQCQTGAVSALPAASKSGNLYLASDGPYLYRDTGAAQVAWLGPRRATPIVSADFSWVNQGTATLTSAGGVPMMTTPTSPGSDDVRIRAKTLANPVTVTGVFSAYVTYTGAGYTLVGLGVRNSGTGHLAMVGGLLASYAISNPFFGYYHCTSPTSLTQVGNTAYYGSGFPYILMRLVTTATQITYEFSADGANWIVIATETLAAAGVSNPDQFFWYTYSRSSGTMYASILGWDES